MKWQNFSIFQGICKCQPDQSFNTIMNFICLYYSLAWSETANGLRVRQHMVYDTGLQRTTAWQEVLLNTQMGYASNISSLGLSIKSSKTWPLQFMWPLNYGNLFLKLNFHTGNTGSLPRQITLILWPESPFYCKQQTGTSLVTQWNQNKSIIFPTNQSKEILQVFRLSSLLCSHSPADTHTLASMQQGR